MKKGKERIKGKANWVGREERGLAGTVSLGLQAQRVCSGFWVRRRVRQQSGLWD